MPLNVSHAGEADRNHCRIQSNGNVMSFVCVSKCPFIIACLKKKKEKLFIIESSEVLFIS